MRWDISNYPSVEDGMDLMVLHKAIEIANTFEDGEYSDEDIISQSNARAQKWYDNMSMEEKEEYKKKFPGI